MGIKIPHYLVGRVAVTSDRCTVEQGMVIVQSIDLIYDLPLIKVIEIRFVSKYVETLSIDPIKDHPKILDIHVYAGPSSPIKATSPASTRIKIRFTEDISKWKIVEPQDRCRYTLHVALFKDKNERYVTNLYKDNAPYG